MPARSLLIGVALFTALAVFDLYAAVGPTNCGIMYRLRDNLTIKVDVADGQLHIDTEGSFRVYLHNTLSQPFWNVKLEVLTAQFDVTVVPSPSWKTYPDLQSSVTGGSREYFTVTLKRKTGVPDGPCDVSLRVYSSRYDVPKLNAVLTLAEALDQHETPLRPGLKIDGQVRPQDWSATPVFTDFSSYTRKNGEFFYCRPADQTRVRLAADSGNLYMLVSCMGAYDRSVKGNEFQIFIAPEIESKAVVLTLDESTGQITSNPPVLGLQCVKCPDDPEANGSAALYAIQIPRQSLGLTKEYFHMNFRRTVADRLPGAKPMPEYSCWRGNEASVGDPAVFGRMVIHEKK
jgi:hypothetical protein